MHTTLHGSDTYRLQHPTMLDVLHDLRIPANDPGPGDRIPTFDLPTTDGARFASSDFDGHGRPALLVFGSQTCPVTESAGAGLVELHRRFGHSVRFVVVNVREAHPGAAIPQPQTFDDKARHAEDLKAHHGFEFDVAIDDIDGTVHRAFGPRPSSAYLIDPSGTIVFRAHWSNVTDALAEALDAVTAGRPVRRARVGHTMRSMLKMTGHASTAFRRAGRGAMADTWRAAAPAAAMISVSNGFAFLSKDRRGVPTLAAIAVLITGMVAAIIGVS